jgi:two-component system sensor histidine kinase UhpB
LIKAAADKPEIIAKVGGQIASNCDAMQVSFRQLIQDLHPVILEQLGFIEAIKALIDTWQQTHSINVASTFIDEMPEMSDEHNTHLYRIVQESLNNVAQHAGASNVDVTLAIDNSELVLSIHDDGRWSESNTTNTGLGLRSMKERAHCMNGNFQFTHSETEGTTVVLRIPILKEVT